MIKPKKILVVGGNAAGPAAAAKAKRVNPDAEIIMFEAGKYISTGTCEIPYVISGEIKNPEQIIFFDEASFFDKKGVKVYTLHKVESIDRQKKCIAVINLVDQTSSAFEYDKLILATGAKTNIPSIFDRNLENVFALKSVGDLIKIKEYMQSNPVKSAAIVGAGYIGLEAAESLKSLGADVSLIHNHSMPLNRAEPEIQTFIKEQLIENEILFYPNAKVSTIKSENNKIKCLNVDNRLIEVDLVIITTGLRPENTLAESCGLSINKNGALNVDRKMRTSDQHIFAAGDNTEALNFITNNYDYIPLATIARDNGYVAGENAAGGNALAEPVIKNIAVRILGKYFVSVGITAKQAFEKKFLLQVVNATARNLVHVMPGSDYVFGKLIFERRSKIILGASFWGGKEISGYGDLISALIRSRQTIDILSKINYNYTPPLSPFRNLLSVLGKEAMKQLKS